VKVQAPCFKQDKKANEKCVGALQALCALWLPWCHGRLQSTLGSINADLFSLDQPSEQKRSEA